MKVLIPVSGAADAKLVLDFVSNYHWPPNTQFRVIHILDSVPDAESAPGHVEHAAHELTNAVRQRITETVEHAQISAEVMHGPPVGLILQTAVNWLADMIVLGYRTRSAAQRFLAGSVSRNVSMHAPCSVIVVRPPQTLSAQEIKVANAVSHG